jgi:hypothetical protein
MFTMPAVVVDALAARLTVCATTPLGAVASSDTIASADKH